MRHAWRRAAACAPSSRDIVRSTTAPIAAKYINLAINIGLSINHNHNNNNNINNHKQSKNHLVIMTGVTRIVASLAAGRASTDEIGRAHIADLEERRRVLTETVERCETGSVHVVHTFARLLRGWCGASIVVGVWLSTVLCVRVCVHRSFRFLHHFE
jgi:hypothetical protein